MSAALQYTKEEGRLRLSGDVRRGVVRELAQVLSDAVPDRGTLELDLVDVASMDSAAVAALIHAWRQARARESTLLLGAASPAAERALSMFRLGPELPTPPPPSGAIEALGGNTIDAGAALVDFLQLTADATFAVFAAIRDWRRTRWGAVMDQSIYIGSQALPIVGLISFLVGLTLAFQSATQLQQFGASIFVANLIGVSVVSEMGPLMTAILVAGRSGSSIAAEIATMQVSEEIDALNVMGIEPIGYLAVPRLLAIILMMPLLTIFADALGILGGFLVGTLYLDIAWNAFLNQTLDAITTWNLTQGLIKSVAFAYGIALIGLFYGFRVSGGAGEVGRTTTASVVASIFFIIVADCLFSVLFFVIL